MGHVRVRTPGGLGLAAAGAAAMAHVVPAGSWLPGVRRAVAPGLAGRGRADHVALTFDDGPDPVSTPEVVAALARSGVRATFFVVGREVERWPEVVRGLVAAGHEVGVHGWRHGRPWRPAPLRERAELRRCVEVIEETCGVRPRWYRPPYGILTGDRWAAAVSAGLDPVLWSAWGRDWAADATTESVLRTVLKDLDGGGTVLLHDTDRESAPGSWRVTVRALPELVAYCRHRGWSVGPLAEHRLPGGAGPGRTVARGGRAG